MHKIVEALDSSSTLEKGLTVLGVLIDDMDEVSRGLKFLVAKYHSDGDSSEKIKFICDKIN